MESEKKMAELVGLTRESEGYDVQLKYYSNLIPAAEDKLIIEEKLNCDWEFQKKRFKGKYNIG